MEYQKLIRDLIPNIIAASGRRCETRVLPETAYRDALRDKLIEEAQEVKQASPGELATEIADVLEVVDALLEAHGLDIIQVKQLQADRRRKRGGFTQRLQLLRVEDASPE
jgi:predicted house-cleaning noncanonical NTP pyrophosphatase (MazG superfamily)